MTWTQINAFDPVTNGYKLLWTTPPPGPATPDYSMPTVDAWGAPFSTLTAVGAASSFGTYATCRSIAFLMTSVGNAVVTFGSVSITLPLVPGWNQYPFTGCTLTSLTGTGTAYALN